MLTVNDAKHEVLKLAMELAVISGKTENDDASIAIRNLSKHVRAVAMALAPCHLIAPNRNREVSSNG